MNLQHHGHAFWYRAPAACSWSESWNATMPMPRFAKPPEVPAEQEARFRELLAKARDVVPTSTLERRAALHQLAHYLGATVGEWFTRKLWYELHEVLGAGGETAIEATLATARLAPRDEVIEEAAAVLETLSKNEDLLEDLARRLRVSDSWAVRATIVRGLAAEQRDQGYERRRALVVELLEDPDVEVRAAAAAALGAMNDPACRPAIEAAHAREQEPSIKEELAELLTELPKG
jgi:hypothetical protein